MTPLELLFPASLTIRIRLRFLMPTSRNLKPARNKPKQARSQATVQAILDGAIRVFDQEGSDAATTSRIAEVAGVSVGTLYQYFADRDAILDALQDREFQRAAVMLGETLSDSDHESERHVAQAVISGLLQLYRNSPGLHRLLAVDGMRVSPSERVVAFDQKMVDILRGFFEVTPFQVARKNRHAAAFVLYQSVRATMLAAICEEPAGLSDEVLVEEVTDLVVGHLVGGLASA